MASRVLGIAPVRARRLTLGLLLCVGLDFASPYLGGAFAFSADESVEGVSLDPGCRVASVRVGPAVPVPDADARGAGVARRAEDGRPPGCSRGWRPELRRVAAVHPGPTSGDDHH